MVQTESFIVVTCVKSKIIYRKRGSGIGWIKLSFVKLFMELFIVFSITAKSQIRSQ